jgi:hypothetical protein
MKSFILILAFFSASAFSQQQDGNEMLERMKKAEVSDNFYMGYITGIAIMNTTACYYSNITTGQIYDVVKIYLEQNPAIRHLSRGVIVVQALNNAFPCKQEANPKKPI